MGRSHLEVFMNVTMGLNLSVWVSQHRCCDLMSSDAGRISS